MENITSVKIKHMKKLMDCEPIVYPADPKIDDIGLFCNPLVSSKKKYKSRKEDSCIHSKRTELSFVQQEISDNSVHKPKKTSKLSSFKRFEISDAFYNELAVERKDRYQYIFERYENNHSKMDDYEVDFKGCGTIIDKYGNSRLFTIEDFNPGSLLFSAKNKQHMRRLVKNAQINAKSYYKKKKKVTCANSSFYRKKLRRRTSPIKLNHSKNKSLAYSPKARNWLVSKQGQIEFDSDLDETLPCFSSKKQHNNLNDLKTKYKTNTSFSFIDTGSKVAFTSSIKPTCSLSFDKFLDNCELEDSLSSEESDVEKESQVPPCSKEFSECKLEVPIPDIPCKTSIQTFSSKSGRKVVLKSISVGCNNQTVENFVEAPTSRVDSNTCMRLRSYYKNNNKIDKNTCSSKDINSTNSSKFDVHESNSSSAISIKNKIHKHKQSEPLPAESMFVNTVRKAMPDGLDKNICKSVKNNCSSRDVDSTKSIKPNVSESKPLSELSISRKSHKDKQSESALKEDVSDSTIISKFNALDSDSSSAITIKNKNHTDKQNEPLPAESMFVNTVRSNYLKAMPDSMDKNIFTTDKNNCSSKNVDSIKSIQLNVSEGKPLSELIISRKSDKDKQSEPALKEDASNNMLLKSSSVQAEPDSVNVRLKQCEIRLHRLQISKLPYQIRCRITCGDLKTKILVNNCDSYAVHFPNMCIKPQNPLNFDSQTASSPKPSILKNQKLLTYLACESIISKPDDLDRQHLNENDKAENQLKATVQGVEFRNNNFDVTKPYKSIDYVTEKYNALSLTPKSYHDEAKLCQRSELFPSPTVMNYTPKSKSLAKNTNKMKKCLQDKNVENSFGATIDCFEKPATPSNKNFISKSPSISKKLVKKIENYLLHNNLPNKFIAINEFEKSDALTIISPILPDTPKRSGDGHGKSKYVPGPNLEFYRSATKILDGERNSSSVKNLKKSKARQDSPYKATKSSTVSNASKLFTTLDSNEFINKFPSSPKICQSFGLDLAPTNILDAKILNKTKNQSQDCNSLHLSNGAKPFGNIDDFSNKNPSLLEKPKKYVDVQEKIRYKSRRKLFKPTTTMSSTSTNTYLAKALRNDDNLFQEIPPNGSEANNQLIHQELDADRPKCATSINFKPTSINSCSNNISSVTKHSKITENKTRRDSSAAKKSSITFNDLINESPTLPVTPKRSRDHSQIKKLSSRRKLHETATINLNSKTVSSLAKNMHCPLQDDLSLDSSNVANLFEKFDVLTNTTTPETFKLNVTPTNKFRATSMKKNKHLNQTLCSISEFKEINQTDEQKSKLLIGTPKSAKKLKFSEEISSSESPDPILVGNCRYESAAPHTISETKDKYHLHSTTQVSLQQNEGLDKNYSNFEESNSIQVGFNSINISKASAAKTNLGKQEKTHMDSLSFKTNSPKVKLEKHRKMTLKNTPVIEIDCLSSPSIKTKSKTTNNKKYKNKNIDQSIFGIDIDRCTITSPLVKLGFTFT